MEKYLGIFKEVLINEAKAIEEAAQRVEEGQIKGLISLFEVLITSGGSLFFCGVGKSRIIGEKLAATFTSLGLPSFNIHPTEALHGDLGRIRKIDSIVFISKSGTTEEIIKLLPYVNIPKKMRIGLFGEVLSPLAKECGVVFNCAVDREVCLNNQAPTSSSTVTLALGDAMAIVFEGLVDLSKEGFAVNHPGGILGKSLRLTVKDLMLKRDECPMVTEKATLREVILELTEKNVGLCAVLDNNLNELLGIIVEGDIRRSFNENKNLETKITEIMTAGPVTAGPDDLAFDVLKLMEDRKSQISQIPIVKDNKFLGVIRLHDLFKNGFGKQA